MRIAFVLTLSVLWSLAMLLVRAPLGLSSASPLARVASLYFAAIPWGVLGYLLVSRRARAVR